MRMRLFLAAAAGAATAAGGRAAPAPSDDQALYQAGQQLFDQYAPPEVKAEYAFPTQAEWDAFTLRLQRALAGDALDDLAQLEPEAAAALAGARLIPGDEDYAGWLERRLDEIQGAAQAVAAARPGLRPSGPRRAVPSVPLYDLWLARVRARPAPTGAAALMPGLRAAFAAEGVPPDLAWLAEAESGLDPSARSPAGAKGLFQLMPDTAHALGLGTFLPDERVNPKKSAHAAARYLRQLYARFGSWPLALAAYNAGEGRVARALAGGAENYAAAAARLPSETRMYVPKVLALVRTRTGAAPDQLGPPRG
jgi:membrane-bound lytic murein transglycosylase D